MKIVIDADGCPVIDESISLAKKYNIEIILVCDTSHEFSKHDVKVITVSKGADSADFKIVNLLQKEDIVVTQDYGLASMCLAKQALCINQDGVEYNEYNIDALLHFRHEAKKMRSAGKNSKVKMKAIPKRDKKVQNQKFSLQLEKLIKNQLNK